MQRHLLPVHGGRFRQQCCQYCHWLHWSWLIPQLVFDITVTQLIHMYTLLQD